MQFKYLLIPVLLLVALSGCGGDSSGPVSPSTGDGGANSEKFGSLLESGYTVEKLVGDLGEVSLQVAGVLEKRLTDAIAGCKAQVSRLKLAVQRFSADALLSSAARATRDSLESRRGDLEALENKLAAVLKRIGLQKISGK